ncbi:MAG TPA: hypothetical protein VNZ53_09490 [Steroidobacteraceae bacterium]|jgi:hypothetical protein|nr:hypothetical protein [Steroidobacteraceae bacterium]
MRSISHSIAHKDGDETAISAIRAERRQLLDHPASIDTDDRAALIAVWPATLPPLPLEFTDPVAAAASAGPALVVDLRNCHLSDA